MNAPIAILDATAGPLDLVEAWFASLGPAYLGRVPSERLGPNTTRGWRVVHGGRVIDFVVDKEFPYSKPMVFIEDYGSVASRSKREPHVEGTGKLCLPPIEFPHDPVQAVKTALADSMRLLSENEVGVHAEDFQEDFGLYWSHWKTEADGVACVLPISGTSSHFGFSVASGGRLYAFPSKDSARRFLDNLRGEHIARPRRMAFLRIFPLPGPDRYPDDGASVWNLVASRSPDGLPLLAELLKAGAEVVNIVLFGRSPSGREHHAALQLSPKPVPRNKPVSRRLRNLRPVGEGSSEWIASRFAVRRLSTRRLDAASSRLPYFDRDNLAAKRIVIVGCGALGAGVAKMLAQAGVGWIYLVDPETLAWENIRRHELGGSDVGRPKAEALADRLRRTLPNIGHVEGFQASYRAFASKKPELADGADLTVSCTGSGNADMSVEARLHGAATTGGVVYGWMEEHALAAHAVWIGRDGPKFADGFDATGAFRLNAIEGSRPPPPECGGSTSPFGPVELAQAQSLLARLSIDALRGKFQNATWRTWLADRAAIEEAEARWSPRWLEERGDSPEWGGVASVDWRFR